MLISKHDQRSYVHYVAPSGLRVLLVQDQHCKNAAAAMSIAAGHFDDPAETFGLAHLLEHVLFLGSEQFPDANGFQSFLAGHGGSLNAWTGTEHANFHFEVDDSFLPDALNIFSDMLINPLMDVSLIDKEINSIDAEFKLKIKDDLRRLYQVHKETCNPLHPFSQFSVGNNETLRNIELAELQTALKDFHNQHYVAKNMCLCIVSRHSAEALKKLLSSSLAHLSDFKLVEKTPYPPLYLPNQLGVQISIKPLKEARRMIVSFALPDVQKHYKVKPLDYVSHLLGDESQGSLLSHFKHLRWVTNLSAGGGINGSNFKDFNLNLQLTEFGLENTESILNCIFYYLKLIGENLDEKWRLEEKAKLGELAFDFSDAAKPLEDATHLSNQLFHYPAQDLISGDYLISGFDTDPIQECLGLMTPKNMRVKIICPEARTDKIAKWYETPYRIEPLPKTLLSALSQPETVEQLNLPDKNSFIISSTVRQTTSHEYEQPSIILERPDINIWFAQDNDFDLPKGDCFISFDCSAVHQGPEISAYKRLWVAMLMEHFSNQFYHAGVAGLHFHLYSHQAGFSLHTNGFSQKQFSLAKELFEQIHTYQGTADCFEQMRKKHLSSLQNALLNKPINRLFTRLSGIVQRLTHAPTELIPYLQNATLERMNEIRTSLLDEYFLEGFIYGDWQIDQATAFSDYLANHPSRSDCANRIKRDVLDLRQEQRFIHEVQTQQDDSAVVVYCQTPSTTTQDIALTILMEQMLATPFFGEMRTEKQLGYLVGSGYLPLNRHPGMALYIQSPVCSAKTLANEIEQFIHEISSSIGEFEPIWGRIRDNVVKQLSDNDTNLTVKSQRLWMAIGNQDHNFNQQENLAQALKSLTFQQVVEFAHQLNNNDGFGRLVLFCAGKKHPDIPLQGTEITEISEFKLRSKYML